MLKMFIDNEEVVSKKDFTIKEEMLNASSTILNNTYPKSWEQDKDYTSRFYYPKDYAKLNIQNHTLVQQAEAGTTIQVNGSATLNDVDASKNSKVTKLLGQTSQTGTPTPSSPIPVNVVSGDNSINVCGKNLVFSKIVNGSIGSTGNIGTNVLYDMFVARVKENTTYTITTDDNGLVCGFFYDIPTTGSTSYNNSRVVQSSKTITAPITGYIAFRTNVNYATPQVEVGSTATNYEPYVGSSYPIYLGVENKFNYTLASLKTANTGGQWNDNVYSYNGVDFTINNDLSITANGLASANAPLYLSSDTSLLKPNTQYTMSGVVNGAITDFRLQLNINSVNAGMVYSTPATFTTASTISTLQCYFVVLSGKQINSQTIKPQIEVGSKANTYTPPNTTPIELCKIGNYQDSIYKGVGSNLFDKDNATTQVAYFSADGTINVGGSSTLTTSYIKITPNVDITISGIKLERICIYDSNKTFIERLNANGTTTNTINVNAYYIRIQSTTSVFNLNTIMINEGTTPLPYEPYNAKDKWLLHKEIGEVVFNGSEDGWVYQSAYTRFYKTFSLAKTNENLYSNYYVRGDTSTDNYVMSISASYIYLRDERYTTTADYKTWLGTHNLIIYYVLATPTTTLITDETLISQLDALESS